MNDVYAEPDDTNKVGWERRVTSLDAGNPEIPDEPEKPDEPKDSATQETKNKYKKAYGKWLKNHNDWKADKAAIIADFKADTITDAEKALSVASRQELFSGDISPLAPYRYKTHYNLGDYVSLYGDYGDPVKMLVSEYVRTEDAEGDRGYPGLALP